MTETDNPRLTPEELGVDLAKLRELAGLNQKDLADRVGMDASRISRIESGKVKLSAVEEEKYLQQIGTDRATAYRKYIRQDWKRLARPSFWHPDREVLSVADDTLGRLDMLSQSLPAGNPLLPQLDMHRHALAHAAHFLESTCHDFAFIGETGVGKSFNLSRLCNLVIDRGEIDRVADRMVLEVGQGGTTLCEVEIRKGPQFGLIVYPQPKEEIEILIGEFCKGLSDEQQKEESKEVGQDEQQMVEEPRRRLSEEVERALRNLMNLCIEPMTGPDGSAIDCDPAEALKKELTRPGELQAELFARIRYNDRKTTQLWHQDESPGTLAMEWLKKAFLDINNGLRKDVPFPQKIDLVVPFTLLAGNSADEEMPYDFRLIDTKGLDKTAIRQDIQMRLDDPRSVLVLCTQFSAFAGSIEGLIKHVQDTGAKTAIATRTVLMVLPKNDDAPSMKNSLRRPVATHEEAYSLNSRRRKAQLEALRADRVPILHLDATRDADVHEVTDQLVSTVRIVREAYAKQLAEIDKIVRDLLENHEQALSRAAHDRVRLELNILLERLAKLPCREQPIYNSLLGAVRSTHWRTLEASVNRRGEWDNLNIYLHLGAGAAIDAKTRSNKFFTHLEGIIEQLLANASLSPVHGFLRQLTENAQRWREAFLDAARRKGEGLLRPSLHSDNELWSYCTAVHGTGYRNEVARTLRQKGLEHDLRVELLEVLEKNIHKEWEEKVIVQFRKLAGERLPNCSFPAESPAMENP